MLTRARAIPATLLTMSFATAIWAADWPAVEDPPRSRTEWVASDVRINGLPSRIIRFESELRPEEVLQFYRDKWKRAARAGDIRDTSASGWQAVSTQFEPYQLAVQVKPGMSSNSEGLISITNPSAAQRDYIPSELPQFSDVAVIQVTDAVDGPKRSRLVSLVSSASADLNQRRWKSEWARKGYALTNEKAMTASEGGSWLATFDKPPHSVDMTIGQDPQTRATHIVVNLVGPADKGTR